MRYLSKSKLIAYRQCPKRLWLAVHRPELNEVSEKAQARYQVGHQIGDIARRLYDPAEKGTLVDAQAEGYASAFERSQSLLASSQPLFEAGFTAEGASAFADVLLPVRKSGKRDWRMVEVKSSGKVHDHHHDDIAIQAFVARAAGVPLTAIALAHIDTKWIYKGDGAYNGLLKEVDLTDAVFSRHDEVKGWVAQAQKVVAKRGEPKIKSGRHCTEPFECGFLTYCQSQEPQPKHPLSWLPKVATKALKTRIEEGGLTDMRQVPDELLNTVQLRVKQHTLSGTTYFDADGAAMDLASHKFPAIFLDFESISFAVPIWKGTHPYENIVFQFSVHRLSRTGKLDHAQFLDLSGMDPSRRIAEALIDACGRTGPVFVYYAPFETARIKELAKRFPRMRQSLLGIQTRIVDLLPIARNRFYHPSQQGHWSIKDVLPAIAGLHYETLDGVQDGGLAMEAYREAIAPETTPERRSEIERQLLAYCRLDTYAMVRLWAFFSGRQAPKD